MLTVYRDSVIYSAVSKLTGKFTDYQQAYSVLIGKQTDKDQVLKSRRFVRKRYVKTLMFIYDVYKYYSSVFIKNFI